jgi:predicted NBD/HSP70 family sugar kinase
VPVKPVPLRELLSADGARDSNRRDLLRVIMTKPGSQVYLSRRSGLAPGTVSSAVSEMEQRGWVSTKKIGNSNIVGLQPTTGAAVGVELGYHYTAIVARRAEQPIDQVRTRTLPYGAVFGAERVFPDIADAICEVVTELGEEEIATVGLGVPRIVDPVGNVLVPPILYPWVNGDDPALILGEHLRRHATPRFTAKDVKIDNGANLAALAESIYRYDDVATLIAVKASTSISAGIILGGKIFRGARGGAGEIGHIAVSDGGKICACGGRGCLDTLIGADALVEQAKIVIADRHFGWPGGLDNLVELAKNGNSTCRRVLREAGVTLGRTLGNLCNVLNPEVIVLGGTLGRPDAARFTLEPCREGLLGSAMEATAAGVGRDESTWPTSAEERKRLLRVEASTLEHPAALGALAVGLQGTDYPAGR